jgi:hypothetical protein
MFADRKIHSSFTLLLLFLTLTFSCDILPPERNYCLSGKDIRNLNSKQKAFNSGPCSPVILVPGFLGTGLQV